MAEVGRKQRKTSLDVGTVSVGVEHGAHRERVSEVVESRPASRRARFQTRKTHKLQERPVNIAVDQPGADGGDEERRASLGRSVAAGRSARPAVVLRFSTRSRSRFRSRLNNWQ